MKGTAPGTRTVPSNREVRVGEVPGDSASRHRFGHLAVNRRMCG